MLEWIDKLFNKHKLVRRMLIIWAPIIISIVTYRVFWHTKGELTGEYIALIGILATIINFYIWSRGRDVLDK